MKDPAMLYSFLKECALPEKLKNVIQCFMDNYLKAISDHKFDQDKFIWSKANHRIWKPFETSSFLEVIRQYTEQRGVYGKTSEEHTHLCTTSDGASSDLSGGIQERKAVLDAEETTSKPPVSSTRQPEKPNLSHRMSPPPPPPPKPRVMTRPQSTSPASQSMKPMGTKPPEKPFDVKTTNVGFQVEKAVHEWLKSDAGKSLIRKMVDKELSERLSKIEKDLIDQMQKIAWDEESDSDIKIVQPTSR